MKDWQQVKIEPLSAEEEKELSKLFECEKIGKERPKTKRPLPKRMTTNKTTSEKRL